MAKLPGMPQRVATVALVLAAALADAAGAHGVAFYALVAAVPFGAAASLAAFDALLGRRDDPVVALQTLLWALCLALVVAHGFALPSGLRPNAVAWSPAGSRLLFTPAPAATGPRELYAIDLDGTHPTRLTSMIGAAWGVTWHGR